MIRVAAEEYSRRLVETDDINRLSAGPDRLGLGRAAGKSVAAEPS
jgi:hypothetical protein